MTAPTNPYPSLAQASALTRSIDPTVLRSIRQASQATSTDFGLLMAQAAQESGFRPDARSSTSSAAGLFQFTDSTWLDMVHRFGAKYGVGQLAQQIGQDASGKPVASNPAVRKQILALRDDPALSASLAGEYDKLNETQVEQALGHKLQRGDLYMAHFLGASGATSLLKAVETRGNTVAAQLLPEAASANPAIFYDGETGQARTVAQIYHSLANKIETAANAFGSADTSTPVPATPTGTASAPAVLAALSPAASVDWSGVKLSPQMLDMLNVVALAALKMSDDAEPQDQAQPLSISGFATAHRSI